MKLRARVNVDDSGCFQVFRITSAEDVCAVEGYLVVRHTGGEDLPKATKVAMFPNRRIHRVDLYEE